MDVDAIVIGSGQAGVPLATRLAASGRRTVLVERSRVGGTCINYGCTPTKTMVASARAAHMARTAGRVGVQAGRVRVDLPAIVARKDAMVRRWREGVEGRLEAAGERLRVLNGHAGFTGEREIEVAGARYRGEIVVINPGVRPARRDVEGLAALPWLDNRRSMELTELPRHLIVLGGGYIGCEFAQMFRRFGSTVRIIQRGPHLLDREDPDVSEALESVFRSEGIELLLGKPARSRSGPVILSVVCTDPQGASVGLNEREAKARGLRHEGARMPFGSIARAIETDETAGLLKLIIDPDSERILGANVVGAEGGELIHAFAALMQAGATARAIVDVEIAHPTFAEGLQSVAMRLPRYALS